MWPSVNAWCGRNPRVAKKAKGSDAIVTCGSALKKTAASGRVQR